MNATAFPPSIPSCRRPHPHHRFQTTPHRAAAAASASSTAAIAGAANKVRLGDSHLLVSECCLGTMTWGQQNTEEEAHQQLSYALLDCGLNFIDTAEIYPVPPKQETQGQTDRFIGSWLKKNRGSVKREDLVIASKVSGYGRQTYLRKDGSFPRVNAKNIVESVDSTLSRLGVTEIELLQIHWPDRYVPVFLRRNFFSACEGDFLCGVARKASFFLRIPIFGLRLRTSSRPQAWSGRKRGYSDLPKEGNEYFGDTSPPYFYTATTYADNAIDHNTGETVICSDRPPTFAWQTSTASEHRC